MRKALIRVLALSSLAELCILCFQPIVRPANATPPPSGYVLVWSDEFDGAALDTTKWAYWRPGVKRRDAVMTRDAVSVSGGELVIITYTQDSTHHGGMVQTGTGVDNYQVNPPLIISNEITPPGNKYLPRYGYIEASIDFDGASGMWHSFFVQTPNNLLNGPMDEHQRGVEIDIVEHQKFQGPDTIDVSAQAPSALHWMREQSPNYPNGQFWHAGGGEHPGNGSLANGFHTYGVEWTPTFMKFYYDSNLVWTANDSSGAFGSCSSPCRAPACPGQAESLCVTARVPRIAEYMLLCSEIPAYDNTGIHSYGPSPALPFGFGPKGHASNPKMKVRWVRHSQFVPAAPSGLTATAVSGTQINLSWTDNSYPEDGFKIERSTDNVNFSQITMVPAESQTYQNTGLSTNTQYYYRVRAYNGAGNSSYTNTANATTSAPAAPSSLTATAVSGTQINLAWTDNASAEDGFKIERSLDNTNFSQIATVGSNVVTYQNTALFSNMRYYYRVRSYNAAGNSSYSNTANDWADVTGPAAVTDLAIPSIGKFNIALSWTTPGDHCTSAPVTQYDLRRSTSAITEANFGSATQISTGTPEVSGYPVCVLISGLSSCTTYYFAIKSMDAAGNWSAISNVPNGRTICQANAIAECEFVDNDGVAPAAVTNLAIGNPTGKYNVAVSWTAPGDDGSSGTATEYDFRFSTSSINSSNFSSAIRIPVCAPQGAGSAECQLVGDLSNCTTYYFALKTRDEWGNWSAISNVPSGTTQCTQNLFAECDLGLVIGPPPTDETLAVTDEGVLSFSPPRPNPARGTMNFQISVPSSLKGTKLNVGVFDLAGRRVRTLANQDATLGPSQIEWNLLDDSGQRVAPAMYRVRVDIGGERKIFPFVVLR